MNTQDKKDKTFLKETEVLHNLRALEEIEKNSQISQRELSHRLGIALGITNALLKTLVRKGLIKIRGENNRSLTYHLTHAGVLAKGKLAVDWTLNTIDLYRHAKGDVFRRLSILANTGVKTVVLYGMDELTEIALIVSADAGVEVKGIIDGPESGRTSMFNLPIGDVALIAELKPDAVIVCIEPDEADMEKLLAVAGNDTKIYKLT